MQSDRIKLIHRGAWAAALSLAAASALPAQNRLVLPAGSVIIVQNESALESSTARVGQTFETRVVDTVGMDSYAVIPAGSRIRGTITFAQPANRQQSGVIEVNFDRLTLADGTTFAIDGRLTSTDVAERRQIESDPNARVVLVGGRGGVGAAIAGAGSSSRPVSGILGALGTLLSQAQDVRVAAGTTLAIQLEQGLVLRGRGRLRATEGGLITSAESIRAAQRALAQQNYYRGPINGIYDAATQRALVEFQYDKNMVATGNLDGRTAQALGINTSTGVGGDVGSGVIGGGMVAMLSPEEASLVRRNAQSLVGRQRQELSISTIGRFDPRRAYAEGDVELWFALSAFADNASLYEQLVRVAGNAEGSSVAGRALIAAARRVDAAFQRTRSSSTMQSAWATMRRQLGTIDNAYASAAF